MAAMTNFGALFALVSLAAGAAFGVRLWAKAYNETGRRILRSLRKVLKGETDAFIIDYGRSCGVGFNFTSMTVAVAWDAGDWCLVYGIDELAGVELSVDHKVEGWAFSQGKPWAADPEQPVESRVVLRHLFDDPRHPDFVLELWSAEGERDDTIPDARTAIEKANAWLDGMAALMATVRRRRFEVDRAA